MVRMTKEYYLDSTSWNFKEGRTRMYIKGWVADVFVLMVINISLAGGLKMHTFSSYSLKNYVIVFKIRWPDNINHILKIKSDIKERFRQQDMTFGKMLNTFSFGCLQIYQSKRAQQGKLFANQKELNIFSKWHS